jgi:hypothetical protein
MTTYNIEGKQVQGESPASEQMSMTDSTPASSNAPAMAETNSAPASAPQQ